MGLKDPWKSLMMFPNLLQIRLDDNRVKTMPEDISRLSNLTMLAMSNNHLKRLPDGITELTNLTRLTLQKNQLTALPTEMFKLTKMHTIYLSGNKGLPTAFQQRIANSAGRVQLLFKAIADHYPKKPKIEPSVALAAVPASALTSKLDTLPQQIAAVESQLLQERKT